MVVSVHFSNRVAPGIPDATALLDHIEGNCRATESPDEVRSAIGNARIAAAGMLESPSSEVVSRAEFLRSLGIEPDSDDAARIAYAVANDFAALESTGVGKVRINLKLGQFKGQAQHIRLPSDPARPLASQRFWRDFIGPLIPTGAPQLCIASATSPWLDIIVGLPAARQLFCLRAGDKALPPAHHIPFNLSDAAKASATARWRSFLGENGTA